MTNEHSTVEAAAELPKVERGHPEDPPAGFVMVELNGDPFSLHRGNYTGAHLKDTLHVPREHVLEQVIDAEFKPVENDAHLKIRGEEVFVSHCGQGQSS
jgi:hypothetical protein